METRKEEIRAWVQVLLFIVYQPMVAAKSVQFPLNKIISQLSTQEKDKVTQGISALIELEIFVMDGNDICITEHSEWLLRVLDYLSGKSEKEIQDELKKHPKLATFMTTILSDHRLSPPSKNQTTSIAGSIPTQPLSGKEVILAILFFVIILAGLMKVFFKY